MFVLSIIPLTKIPLPSPQILDYFSAEEVAIGGVVQITLGSRGLLGIVVASVPVTQQKQNIKKSAFRLKSIEKIIARGEAIPKPHLKLIFWTSNYFYSPLSLVAKTLLPQIFSKPTKKFITEPLNNPHSFFIKKTELDVLGLDKKTLLYWNPDAQQRTFFYQKKIDEAIQSNRQILFLVPELWKIDYFQQRIPALKSAVVVHSAILRAKEFQIWQDAQSGKINCILGTRSALSIYLPRLGLIIIDQEESPFYKSFDQQPYINAKDVALKIAEQAEAPVILGANLPSVETYWKFRKSELQISSRKVQNSKLTIVDMREELKAGNYSVISRTLRKKLASIVESNAQALLFINRKGLATGLLCRDCGNVIKCPDCDLPMVYNPHMLVCRHCARRQPAPSVCPKCQGYRIKYIGAGTERVKSELVFNGKVACLDLDSAPVWEKQHEILDDFKNKKYNILIGTQLMLKEELLPEVSLAAIITIDPLLSLPDFRMGEEIIRIIYTLSSISSKLILQTYRPDNEMLLDLPQYELWFQRELKNREELAFPPFSQIIKFTYFHRDSQKAEREAHVLKNKLQQQIIGCQLSAIDYEILGPVPAFIPRVANRYIWQIMIKSKIQDISLRNKLVRVAPSEWKIDVDPVEML